MKPPMQRSATTDLASLHEQDQPKADAGNPPDGSPDVMRKSVSMDSGEAEVIKKTLISTSGSFKRRSIRVRILFFTIKNKA